MITKLVNKSTEYVYIHNEDVRVNHIRKVLEDGNDVVYSEFSFTISSPFGNEYPYCHGGATMIGLQESEEV